jgi:hypothetical protein
VVWRGSSSSRSSTGAGSNACCVLADATQLRTSPSPETGSFRDWDGRVFRVDGRILRALTVTGLEDWNAVSATEFFRRFTASGELVETHAAEDGAVEALRRADPDGGWVAALSHERLPFVSYPYEWPFSMLKDAALLQLRLARAALAEGVVVKDASPYNVQWRGSQPVFIDVGSFERARPGEPWTAYRQFCQLYLYPLLLEAYRGVPLQSWLRASLDGIPPQEFRSLFALRDALRRGMLKHVFLHARLERTYAGRGSEVRRELGAAGFGTALVEANLAQMEKLVSSLRPRPAHSVWNQYQQTCGYTDADRATKEEFLRRAVGRRSRSLVWDLGCNDGRFSLLAAETAAFTVAIDSDRAVVDALYASLRDDGNRSILPLVVDLADPSPSLGWRGRERSALIERGLPDLTLCLALVHHLSITRNIPVRELVDWLRSLDSELVLEFPDREDPMVRRLLDAKRADAHPDYDRATFDALLRDRFDVQESLELPSGSRTLYYGWPR